jgi:hypothetical protein
VKRTLAGAKCNDLIAETVRLDQRCGPVTVQSFATKTFAPFEGEASYARQSCPTPPGSR